MLSHFSKEKMALTIKELEKTYHFSYSEVLVFEDEELKKRVQEILEPKILSEIPIDWDVSKSHQKFLATAPSFDYEIRYIADSVGVGVFTKEPLSKGAYLGEYTGLLTTAPPYLSMHGYLFRYPIEAFLKDRISIDAKNVGNLTRFYNHSFSPNADKHLIFDGGYLHWIFLSNRPIAEGEQITYNYGHNYWYLWGNPVAF